jgi:signal transduction histidine kinase
VVADKFHESAWCEGLDDVSDHYLTPIRTFMTRRGVRYFVSEGRGRGVERHLPPESRLYALSAVLAALALVQAATTTTGAPVRVVEVAVPLVLAGVPAYAGRRIRGQRRRRERSSAAVRAALGLALVGEAVTLTIVASVVLRGAPAPALLFSGVLSLSAGAAVGVPVGYYYEELVVRRRQLEAENERTRRLNQRLQVLNRVLRHNVRTELTVLGGHLEGVLAGEAPGEFDVGTSAERCRESFDRLHDVVEKIRRLEALGVDPELSTLDLVPVVERRVAALREAAPGVAVETSLPDAAPVRAHPLVETALEEALGNAVEHNDHDDLRVSVSVRPVDGDGDPRVELVVADTGRGIPEHELAPLERPPETPLDHASGVGLWFIRWVAAACHGTVRFEENDPSGTAVRLRLPAAREPEGDG